MDRPESNIIGPRRYRGAGAFEVGITRGAQQAARSQRLPRCPQITIGGSEMHAVGINRQRQGEIVIDQQARAKRLAEAEQGARGFGAPRLIGTLVPVLDDCRTPTQGSPDPSQQRRHRQTLRGDRVEAAQRVANGLQSSATRFIASAGPEEAVRDELTLPGRKPAASDCQVYSWATRTACPPPGPWARWAAMAEASVQPEPW
jgi:hypothetical protein